MGGVSDVKVPAGLAWFVRHRLLMLLGQGFTEILPENKKIIAREMDIAQRTMSCIIKQHLGLGAFKQQTGLCLVIALIINRKRR